MGTARTYLTFVMISFANCFITTKLSSARQTQCEDGRTKKYTPSVPSGLSCSDAAANQTIVVANKIKVNTGN